MSINPPLALDQTTSEVMPLLEAGEVLLLCRDGVVFGVQIPNSRGFNDKLRGNGRCYLTSSRLVFVKTNLASEPSAEWQSFEVPLRLVREPKFQQPIFGANYMEGKVDPNTSSPNPLRGSSIWTFTFNKGGCGTFLPMFYRVYSDIVHRHHDTRRIQQEVADGRLGEVAYIDPNDPSRLFLSQPLMQL